MSFDFDGADEYQEIAARFGLTNRDEDDEARGRKAYRRTKKSRKDVVAELADNPSRLENEFQITYKPARYEAIWLQESLAAFFQQGLLEDVLALVKGGKEANVYLCRAAPHLQMPYLAAKVYRPRQFRNLRNDKVYREGRELLNSAGIPIKNRNNREMRAINKKTDFGAELTHVSWLMHEFVTLQRLHGLGADVPEPVAAGGNAILMGYVGDQYQPAPVLHGLALPAAEAEPLLEEVLRNVELMLRHGMIHGDLSAYNILYWEGQVTLIDFPQVTLSESNHNAFRIFQRDVRRVCEYVAGLGVMRDSTRIVQDLWDRYVRLAPGRTVQDEP